MIYINPYSFGGFSNLYCVRMDAVNEYLFRSSFSLHGFTQYTVALRFRSTSAAGDRYLISFPQSSAGTNGCDLYLSAGILKGTARTSTGTALDTGILYNDNNWYVALLWYDGANARIYVDNVQRATAAKTGTVSLTANEFNVNRFGTFGSHAGADYDEISIWNIALDSTGRGILNTPSNLSIHPNAANLVAWYRCGDDPLDNMTGTTGTIRDQVGSNHLTPFNTEAADKILI